MLDFNSVSANGYVQGYNIESHRSIIMEVIFKNYLLTLHECRINLELNSDIENKNLVIDFIIDFFYIIDTKIYNNDNILTDKEVEIFLNDKLEIFLNNEICKSYFNIGNILILYVNMIKFNELSEVKLLQ